MALEHDSKETQISLRLPSSLLDKADELTGLLQGHPELLAWSRFSRSAIIRLALAKGLAVLEGEAASGSRAK